MYTFNAFRPETEHIKDSSLADSQKAFSEAGVMVLRIDYGKSESEFLSLTQITVGCICWLSFAHF